MSDCIIHFMKKTLIIGSCTVDITVSIPSLPSSAGSVNSNPHVFNLGGCAYNVARVLNLLDVPHLHCTTIGSGIYGEFALKELEKQGIKPFRLADKPHGACICLVENNGERSFIAYHGIEYSFDKSYLDGICLSDFDSVYVCGLEIEDEGGDQIISFLEENRSLKLYFSPGPRLRFIDSKKLDSIFALNPVIHLSQSELFEITKLDNFDLALKRLYERTQNDIIITLGSKGAVVYTGNEKIYKDAFISNVVDTTGAGDCHIGSYISFIKKGFTKADALQKANYLAAKVVSHEGPALVKADLLEECDN